MRSKLHTMFGLLAALGLSACGQDSVNNGGPGSQCNGGKCDNAEDDDADGPAIRCEALLEDMSGNGRSVEDIMASSDPIAEFVLSSEAERCPMSVADIVEELNAAGCSDHGSQLVSERSQILGVFTDYRSVTQFDCDGKSVFLHFPILASDVKDIEMTEMGPRLGQGINKDRLLAQLDHTFPAIIAENESGIFNFYQARNHVNRVCAPQGGFAVEDQVLPEDVQSCDTSADCGDEEECIQRPDDLGVVADFRFFGDSMDFVNLPDRDKTLRDMAEALPGPVTTEADIEHSLDIERNCAVCHPNGGLTMRELKSPWVHWDAGGHFSSPQGGELISEASDILGREKNGASFEFTVKNGNRDYNKARIEASLEELTDSSSGFTTGLLMRPLLCTDEFNLLTTGGRPDVDLTSMPFKDAVLDERIASFSMRIDNSHEAFLEEIEKNNWQLWGFSAGAFKGILDAMGRSTPRETLGTLTFVERANIDQGYLSDLVDRGVIDNEMVNDALSIDFTRSVFSEERCGLVDVFDQVDPSVYLDGDGEPLENAPQLMREALIEVLSQGTSNSAERDFLGNLQEDGTDAKAQAEAFVEVCRTRDPGEMLADFVTYVAQVTKRAANEETAMETGEPAFIMFRFPGANGFMMPDALGQSFQQGLRLDPDTCELSGTYSARRG